MPSVLYLHGFLSSPKSTKARVTQQWLQEHFPSWDYHCPQLSSYPHLARQELIEIYQSLEEAPFVIGSSLGGFWATWCVETFGGKAALINPAVAPHTRFQHFVGQALQSYYSEDIYTLSLQDLEVLQACDREFKTPSPYFLLLQTGDETLDYRMALAHYNGAKILLEKGGSHSFDGYEAHLDSIVRFFTSH